MTPMKSSAKNNSISSAKKQKQPSSFYTSLMQIRISIYKIESKLVIIRKLLKLLNLLLKNIKGVEPLLDIPPITCID
jgi:hypothetical protein